MKRTRRGDDRDIRVRKVLEELGFTVGSRRHIPGPGDLLGVRPVLLDHDVCLVEVKSTAQGAWERFSGDEREFLAEAAHEAGGTGYVAWWPPGGHLRWYVVRDRAPGEPVDGPTTMLIDAPAPGVRRGRPGEMAAPRARQGVVGARGPR